jgi:hypothetical protein
MLSVQKEPRYSVQVESAELKQLPIAFRSGAFLKSSEILTEFSGKVNGAGLAIFLTSVLPQPTKTVEIKTSDARKIILFIFNPCE